MKAKLQRGKNVNAIEKVRKPVLCFDLQNVITVPRANVSNMFYKRKLNVYNLTGHLSLSRKGYCVVWHESLSGRSGNDIACALMAMLEKVFEMNTTMTENCLWSDSCVPQNRNSLMSLALMHFMTQHPTITKIIQKFCEPGHSSIQEVDNIHSQIEKTLQVTEVFSPLGVVRALLATNRHRPFEVIHMNTKKLIDYQTEAKSYKFNTIPYTKVKVIVYNSLVPCCLEYKTSFLEEQFVKVCVIRNCQCGAGHTEDSEPKCNIQPRRFLCLKSCPRENTALSEDKVRDIQSMFPYMPEVDKKFMETVISSSCMREKSKDGLPQTSGDGDVTVANEVSGPPVEAEQAAENRRCTRSQKAISAESTLLMTKKRKLFNEPSISTDKKRMLMDSAAENPNLDKSKKSKKSISHASTEVLRVTSDKQEVRNLRRRMLSNKPRKLVDKKRLSIGTVPEKPHHDKCRQPKKSSRIDSQIRQSTSIRRRKVH
jgi:hypothetical protein